MFRIGEEIKIQKLLSKMIETYLKDEAANYVIIIEYLEKERRRIVDSILVKSKNRHIASQGGRETQVI